MSEPSKTPPTTPPESSSPAIGPLTRRLVRRFSGRPDAELERAERSVAYALVEGYVSVVVNLALFALKLVLGLLSGSIALIADAVHTASDSLTSVVVVVSAYIARQPPDTKHPYGHGRIEYVAAVVIALLLGVAGFEFGKASVLRIIHPKPLSAAWLLVGIVIASAGVKEWLAQYANRLSKRAGNRALAADAWHHRSDAIATVLVGLGMIGARLGLPWLDGVAGALVSVLLLKVAYDIAREAVDPILGVAPTPEEIQDVKLRARKVEGVLGVHDVVIHRYGDNVFISLHVETSAGPSAVDLHALAESVEERVAEGDHGSVCVHVDPVDRDHPAWAAVHKIVSSAVSEYPDMHSFHDLRLVGSAEQFNVVLDLSCDPEGRDSFELVRHIEEAIHARYPKAGVVVEIEPAYSY